MTHFIVQTATAHMPSKCKGRYGRVAVLEVDANLDRVSMISVHATGCYQVVATWERLNIGYTERCAFRRAVSDAEELADKLNHEWSCFLAL